MLFSEPQWELSRAFKMSLDEVSWEYFVADLFFFPHPKSEIVTPATACSPNRQKQLGHNLVNLYQGRRVDW